MNIIVNGALGRMGQEVCRLVQEEGHTLAARVDRSGTDGCYAHLADYTGPADVVIDFSNHACAGELMAYCVGRNLPLVAATTGYTEEEFQAIRAGAEEAVRRLRAGGAGMSVPLPRRFAATVRYKEHKDAYRRSFYPGARLEDSKTISFAAEDWYEVLRFCHFVL